MSDQLEVPDEKGGQAKLNEATSSQFNEEPVAQYPLSEGPAIYSATAPQYLLPEEPVSSESTSKYTMFEEIKINSESVPQYPLSPVERFLIFQLFSFYFPQKRKREKKEIVRQR